MTREEAKESLQAIFNWIKGDERWTDAEFKALKMAIKALEEPQWIPVSERLPKDSEYHLVTEYHMVSFARYWEHRWWDAFGDKAKFVTAWMPLPEPYKEGGERE